MKLFFDSSALIPVFYADHEHHNASASVFLPAGKGFLCPSFAGEVYASLTGLPIRPRITGPEGSAIVSQIRGRLRLVPLSEAAEYATALESTSPADGGGAVYDALIAACALKAGATKPIAWDVKHFNSIGLDPKSRNSSKRPLK